MKNEENQPSDGGSVNLSKPDETLINELMQDSQKYSARRESETHLKR